MTPRKFILASRSSQLAQNQTNMVRDALAEAYQDITFETFFTTTAGDHNQSQALYLLGGKALWTKELEVALKEKAVDMLVHCYKDVPTSLPEGCEIAGVLEREDPVDSLVVKKGLPYKSLEELPDGSVVGTSSVRRVAQLKRLFPKLAFMDVVSKLGQRFRFHDLTELCVVLTLARELVSLYLGRIVESNHSYNLLGVPGYPNSMRRTARTQL